jgi:hypothetical protein
MIEHKSTPFRLFLRRNAAEQDGMASDVSKPERADPIAVTLSRYTPGELRLLILDIESVLGAGDEAASRALFQDGHSYHVWSSPSAATDYLKTIVSTARNFQAGADR